MRLQSLDQRQQITGLALKHRLPSSYVHLEYADAGDLFVYAANINENFRRAASFVDRILKGVKPGELPFELPIQLPAVDQPQDREGARHQDS